MKRHNRTRLSQYLRENVLKKQRYTCANKPGNNCVGCEGFLCPKWSETEYRGTFNTDGIQFDHVKPLSISHNNEEYNIQALCPSCHAHKTGADGYTNEAKIIEYEKKVYNFIKENSNDYIDFSILLESLTDDLLNLIFSMVFYANNLTFSINKNDTITYTNTLNFPINKNDTIKDKIIKITSIETIKKIISENKTYFGNNINDTIMNKRIYIKYTTTNYNELDNSYKTYLTKLSQNQLEYLCKLYNITCDINEDIISKITQTIPYISILTNINDHTNKKYLELDTYNIDNNYYRNITFTTETEYDLDSYYEYELNNNNIKCGNGKTIVHKNIYYKGDNINDIIEQSINYFGFTPNINYITGIIIKLQEKNEIQKNAKCILINKNKRLCAQTEKQIGTNHILINQKKKIQTEYDNSIIKNNKLQQELDEYKNSLKQFHNNNDELQQELNEYKKNNELLSTLNINLQIEVRKLQKNNTQQQEIIKDFYDSHVNNDTSTINNDMIIDNNIQPINNNILQNENRQQNNRAPTIFSLFGYK